MLLLKNYQNLNKLYTCLYISININITFGVWNKELSNLSKF